MTCECRSYPVCGEDRHNKEGMQWSCSNTGNHTGLDCTLLHLYSTLQIEVVASDNQNPEKTDTSEVIIIVDTDRFNPVFVPNQPSIIYNTNERTPVGTVLGTLNADDNDLRGSIVYEATGEYPGLNFFGVNATTGQVYIMNNLMNDIQATTTYTVSKKKTDGKLNRNNIE